jgi:hypothetical protein
MIPPALASGKGAIRAALEKTARQVAEPTVNHWLFELRNGVWIQGTAEFVEPWLLMRGDPFTEKGARCVVTSDQLWKLLKRNREIGGGIKYVLTGDGDLQLSAEMPLVRETNVADCIGDVVAGFIEAVEELNDGENGKKAHIETVISQDATSEGEPDWRSLCEESGWPFTERAGGNLTVELDVPDGFYPCIIAPRNGSAASAVTEILVTESLSKHCQQALGVLLLTANGIARMIRASAQETPERTTVQFETSLPASAGAAELGHVLSALSVACAFFGQEARALQDEFIAQEYLTARGWHSS